MIILRPYQKDAVETALDFLKNGDIKKRPIVVAPTASGKSIYIAHITRNLDGGVIVLQPSKELLEQNYAKFIEYGGEASIFSASMGLKEVGKVTFAMIGSIIGNEEKFAHVKYILIDECHIAPPKEGSMFMTFLEKMKGVHVMGFTATAFRLKKYRDPFTGMPFAQINLLPRERPHFFNHFLHVTQIRHLYNEGFLAPIKYVQLLWDDGMMKVNTTGAEFSEESVYSALEAHQINQKLPDIVKQSIEKGRKHRLVFVQSVMDALWLSENIPQSSAVHAKMPTKEREEIIRKFRSGEILTVFNVGVLTTGFDFPELDTIIIARPTMSLALYMQMVGRGIRLHPDKKDCVVVDMCGNLKRFGEIEDIEYQQEDGKWVLTNKGKVLSGVRMGR